VQPAVFKVEGGKVTGVQLQANDNVEEYPYLFTKR
jgi:hypothetical protein